MPIQNFRESHRGGAKFHGCFVLFIRCFSGPFLWGGTPCALVKVPSKLRDEFFGISSADSSQFSIFFFSLLKAYAEPKIKWIRCIGCIGRVLVWRVCSSDASCCAMDMLIGGVEPSCEFTPKAISKRLVHALFQSTRRFLFS